MVLVPALATCCPAAHVVCVWQKTAFIDELKLPLLQGASTPFKQNEPAEQLCWLNLHVPVPWLTVYQKPGTSGVAAAHPPGQTVPAGQAPEQLLLLDPWTEPNLPSGQSVHEAWAIMPWNWPTGHGVHETGGGWCASADDEGQLSSPDVLEEYWPAGQPLHSGHDVRGR